MSNDFKMLWGLLVIPPKTQYGLTPCGIECVEIIRVTKKWTLNWKEHPHLCPVYQEHRCPLWVASTDELVCTTL